MILNIRDIGGAGLNSDIAPWDLPENALTYGRNFRISSGKIQSAGGSKVGFDADTEGKIGHVAYTEDYNGGRVWIACTTAGIEYYDGDSWELAYALADEEPEKWSSCRIGQVLFLNHPNHYPLFMENASATGIQKLPWSPGNDSWENICKAKVLCSHKNFLFALGTNEVPDARAAFSSYDDRVRWSHPVEPNGRPYTWSDSSNGDLSSLAGYVTLGRGGMIVGGESLRDSFVIYSDYAINVLDYTGDQLMWRRRTVSQSAGLVSKEAVVEVNGAHFFVSKDDILMFDGNQVQSMLHNRLRKSFQSIFDNKRADSVFAVRNDTQNEIYFCIPERRDDLTETGTPNIAFVFNYRDNNWAIRELDTERQYTHACFGKAPDLPNPWGGISNVVDKELNHPPSDYSHFSTVPDNHLVFWDPVNAQDSWVGSVDSYMTLRGDLYGKTEEDFWTTSVPEMRLTKVSDMAGFATDGSVINPSYIITWRMVAYASNETYQDEWGDWGEWVMYENGVEVQRNGLTGKLNGTLRWAISDPDASIVWKFYPKREMWDVLNFPNAYMRWSYLYLGISANGYTTPLTDTTWSTERQTWQGIGKTPFGSFLLSSSDTKLYNIDTQSPDNEVVTKIERTGIPVGGHDLTTTITRVYPHIEGNYPVDIYVGSQQHAGDSVLWKGPVTFRPGVDRKVDMRVTGELHAIRMEASAEGNFNITGCDVEYSMAGKR